MEIFPTLRAESIIDISELLRRIVDIRNNNDIAEWDANNQLNSYESGFRRSTVSTAAAYSVGIDDLVIDATGTFTLTLSANPVDGQTHIITKADSGTTTTVDGNGKNINGAASFTMATQYLWSKVIYIGGAGEWRRLT